ncbi:hypothetical protein N658DRAFT_206891 [Parathielavia hyrcaniae]|uniref:RING-type domain-containing protein n=1 Tax=Parathielavia hyrcaniae TaxID=113614 RepID=A0AAN6PVW6_9PEZI|nr:hypothetical protein N658DRAFT_206891 [Parathielavia hyrcaniae]
MPVCSVCEIELHIKGIDPDPLTQPGPSHHEDDTPTPPPAAGLGEQPAKPRRLEWGESEWDLRLRDAAEHRLWDKLPHQGPHAAIVLFCGHMVCRQCFRRNSRIAGALALLPPRPMCPTCTCFLEGGRCGHLLAHHLPEPGDGGIGGVAHHLRAPATVIECLGRRPNQCWKCKNLAVVLEVKGHRRLKFRFGKDLWKYRTRMPQLEDDWFVMPARLYYQHPAMATPGETVLRLAIFQGPYGKCFVFDGAGQLHWCWRVDRTGFIHGFKLVLHGLRG